MGSPTLKKRFHDCKVYNYFTRIRRAISFAAFPYRSYNRICDILENISGVGCRIEKQTRENSHWLIVIDGADEDSSSSSSSGSSSGSEDTVVTDVGIADGYFYKDVATISVVNHRLVIGVPQRTNIFRVQNCT